MGKRDRPALIRLFFQADAYWISGEHTFRPEDCGTGRNETGHALFFKVLIYISTLENHRKGWSREIPEPVFSIYLTILFPLLSKQKPKTYLYRLLLLPCC